MKILYQLDDELRLIETKKPVRVLKDGIVFRDGKYYCFAEITDSRSMNAISTALSSCTLDLYKYSLKVKRYKKKALEYEVDSAMIDHMLADPSRFETMVRSSYNISVAKCWEGDVKEFFQWDYPDNLAAEIDREFDMTEFTEIVKDSLWRKLVCDY